MSSPTELGVRSLKRIGRYLEGRRRLVFRYPWQTAKVVDGYSDTDWAGCTKTRKSTSGGFVMLGTHLLKSWSTTQGGPALSSGEAEFYGVSKEIGVSLGLSALLHDVGIELPLRCWTDSTATLGICQRQGLGKLRHLDTRCLWIQHVVRNGVVELRKVLGTENPADLFTKHLTSAENIEYLLGLMGCEFRDGRPGAAPDLRVGRLAENDILQADLGGEAETQEEIEWDGRSHPRVEWEGLVLPEARQGRRGLLPHRQDQLEWLYPRALAVAAEEEHEDSSPGAWELRGIDLGRACAINGSQTLWASGGTQG